MGGGGEDEGRLTEGLEKALLPLRFGSGHGVEMLWLVAFKSIEFGW